MAAAMEDVSPSMEEAERPREQAVEKATRGTEAAKEAAFELREAEKNQGTSALKVMQDQL
jgi:hypothetical protein